MDNVNFTIINYKLISAQDIFGGNKESAIETGRRYISEKLICLSIDITATRVTIARLA